MKPIIWIERGYTPRRLKKRQKMNMPIFILVLLLAIIVKFIHVLIY